MLVNYKNSAEVGERRYKDAKWKYLMLTDIRTRMVNHIDMATYHVMLVIIIKLHKLILWNFFMSGGKRY